MDCVKCTGLLQSKVIGKVVVDSCTLCRGIWFDRQEIRRLLSSLVEAKGELFEKGTAESAMLDQQSGDCPRCNTPLERHESLAADDLNYEQCMDCRGAWLDGGELARLAKDPAIAEVLSFFNELD